MLFELEFWSAATVIVVVLWLGSRLSNATAANRALGKRLGGLAFVCHLVYGAVVFKPTEMTDWLRAVVAAAMVAGFVVGIAWIALPLASSLHRATLGWLWRKARAWASRLRLASASRRNRKICAALQREADAAYQREAPERERRRQREDERQRLLADQRSRRENARAACELLYDLYAPEIRERFPRKKLSQFMEAYMTDAHLVEEVEQRGSELRAIIDQHRQQVKPDKGPRTIQQLAEWYLREKQLIDALPLEDELKQEHLAALDVRYAELTQELLASMGP